MTHLDILNLEVLDTWSRKSLLEWLAWNDRNGIFTDEQSKAEGMEPMTKNDAIELIKKIVTENN